MLKYQRIVLLVVTLCFAEMCTYAQIDSIMQSVTLDSVEIKGIKYTSRIKSRTGGQVTIDLKLLNNLPQILGNADPIHYSQMLPEIQTNGELRGGVNIQGSESSHNVVSIGEVPIYNVCHLLGFFSTFNSSHFDRFNLHRMNDAQSYNRLGGELTMELPDFITEKSSGEFSVGLISSQGTIRLPLNKNTLLTTSARTSYINMLYGHWMKTDNLDITYAFSDFNITLQHQINDHNRITMDYYGGFDDGTFGDQSYTAKMKADWGNQMAALHHDYKKETLQLKNCVYLTSYHNKFGLNMQDISYKLPSSILDLGIKHRAYWKNLSWGTDFIYHVIKPQSLWSEGTVTSNPSSTPTASTAELSLFASYKIPITTHLLCEGGIRGNVFGSKNSKFHQSIDPSIQLFYKKENVELYASYSLKHQYLFQTGFSDVGLPTEFWLSSDNRFPAQFAHSVNLGTSWYLLSGRIKVETNLFYKKLYNQMEYLGSIFDFVNTNYDLTNHLQQGDGKNYGFSIILNKCAGKLSGWMSYTYTHARRTFQKVDQDYTFSPSHERPHEMNAVWTYSLGKHWDFGGTFVYASGTPFTAVDYLTVVNRNIISHYEDFNRSRLNPYCRIDLSVNYKWKSRFAKECGINLSLYNVSARDNELFYYLSTHRDGKFSYQPKSFFVGILPSISYFCKF